MLKIVTASTLAELSNKAAEAPRRRCNFNLHPVLDDPVQRFLNALEPGTYARPHRHCEPAKWELFVILAGAAAILVFDDDGRVTERQELDAAGSTRAVEIPPGTWHSLVALKPGTVLFEFKPGPYSPISDKDFAAWSPAEGSADAADMVERLAAARIGDKLA